jgi:hypothetical protein
VLAIQLVLPYDGTMQTTFGVRVVTLLAVAVAGCLHANAQAPDVPICNQAGGETQSQSRILDEARKIFAGGKALKLSQAKKQLKRSSCELSLADASTTKLSAREVCIAARRSHLRIGWLYLCDKCGKWHLRLAGGYALSTSGAAATCFHVVEPGSTLRDGCLVAVTESGAVFPVAEVLAANRESDACIVRVVGEGFTPLALNTNIYPGDTAYCYSDPAGRRDYFSAGIVNRFYLGGGPRTTGSRDGGGAVPMRMNVSTDWAPGSSGSAVLDECGNAIGHVATISTAREESAAPAKDAHADKPTAMVFHEAVSARDVLRLIRPRND